MWAISASPSHHAEITCLVDCQHKGSVMRIFIPKDSPQIVPMMRIFHVGVYINRELQKVLPGEILFTIYVIFRNALKHMLVYVPLTHLPVDKIAANS